MTAYGIDFGTTNSVVAQCAGRRTRVLAPDAGSLDAAWMAFPYFDRLVPSVFGLAGRSADQRQLFGWEAKLRSEDRIEVIKRFLKDEDGEFPLGNRSWTTTQVATALFRVLAEGVAADGGELRDAVVTVPANSPGRARLNTRVAAGHAGINIAALLNEPTAAALSFAQQEPDVGRVLVYDFGGGTLDITLLEIVDGIFRERASKGVAQLGGVDLDALLRELVLGHLGGTPSWTPGQWRQFQLDCELAKIRLSAEEVVTVLTPDGLDGVEIHRGDFEDVISTSVDLSLDPVRTCLSDVSLDPQELDAVLLIGGTSQIPLVRRKLEELLGRSVVGVERCDPLTAVASGAAVAAGIVAGERDDLQFRVVTEHALGTISRDPEGRKKFSPIIQRNRLLPAKAVRSYRPTHDAAEEIALAVVEGDPDVSLGDPTNVQLGELIFPLSNPRPRSEVEFKVEYRYDVAGVIHVRAWDAETKELLAHKAVSFLDEETARRRSREEIAEVDELFSSAPVPFLTQASSVVASSTADVAASSQASPELELLVSMEQQLEIPAQPPAPVLESPTSPTANDNRTVLVVDGSNVACEGRSVRHGDDKPSLAQLLSAAKALRATDPQAFVYVIVDANFRHRIDPSELPAFEKALVDKELTVTPAGTNGKGDAMVCAAAEKLGATVVSNDSFKELQDRHPWLFDGRVLGAVVFDGLWVFEPRTPVRAKRGILGRLRPGPSVSDADVDHVIGQATAMGAVDPPSRAKNPGPPSAPSPRPVVERRVFISSASGCYHVTRECGALRSGRAKAVANGMHVAPVRELTLAAARRAGHPACTRC